MSVIPCTANAELIQRARVFAEELKSQAYLIGSHGLSEREFIDSGLFRATIERIRGQFAATMTDKRDFIRHVLNYLQDLKLIQSWDSAGESNRHDYSVALSSGRTAVIELKGCLDGNNTNIFERPANADEFIIWSVCTNPGSDPRHNVWSGIHTRLSTEIVSRQQRVDGLVVWDMVCGTLGRPCPKVAADADRITEVGPYRLPPPCIYMFPATVPHPRNNPHPPAQPVERVELLDILHVTFGGSDIELNFVTFDVGYRGTDIMRQTTITRGGVVQIQSGETAIRRT
jgi:hypothetical protein